MQHAHSTVSNKTGIVHKSKTEGCLCNHHCSEKAISIKHSDRVFVALDIQHATRMHRIFICGESGSVTLFHIISQTVRVSKRSY